MRLCEGLSLPDDFEDSWPVLEEALNVYPLHSAGKSHIWQQLRDGQMRLWRDHASFMVTSACLDPAGKWVLTVHLAGGDLETVVAMERELCSLARNNGMYGILITGRRGWLKAFDGYSEAGTMMGKVL